MIYNVHAGHGNSGGLGAGAVGLIDESTEARKVKDLVIKYLRQQGHTVYDCTYNGNSDRNTILREIVKMCNSHKVDLDVSIHLNAARNDYVGDGLTGGSEVFGYDEKTRTIGSAISANISNDLNIRNRGFKINKGLYVLNSTNANAILIECCFVDDKDDTNKWDVDKCAKAIVKGITGKAVVNIPVTHKYKVGQHVEYSSSYPRSTCLCGAKYATGGSGHSKIVAIVSGQAKYKLANGLYVNDGDIRSLYVASITPTTSTKVQYYPKYTGKYKNIADALKAMGIDHKFENRKKIASKNNMNDYSSKPEQNAMLLALLKAGKLVK